MDRVTGHPFATRSVVFGNHGMAATSHGKATDIALDVLKEGGSAVDAAIAANAFLGYGEPTGSGIGGDLFAIVWDAKKKELVGLNGSGRSPMSLTLEELKARGITKIPAHGPLPVSVPGCVDGWFMLHERYGKLPMERLMAPTVQAAREGTPVPQTIAYYLERSARVFSTYPGFKETYMPGGKTPAEGERFANPRLAATLELIGKKGRDGFYKGEVAQKIGTFMKEQGGYLTSEDLAAHHGEWIDPVSTNYRGYDLWELPPNGQGIAALQILNLLEPYDLSSMGHQSADYVHLFTEAKKLAFEDRAHYYADMAFADVPVEHLISKEYANERRKLIDEKKAGQSFPPGNAGLEHGDTVYLCTADSEGNMVSLIQSNYRGMGSGMVPSDLGFMLQDRGELFDMTPGRANSYAPGKRPFHTIIPAFVTHKGEPYMAYGVMGGATQPQAHAQILINMIDFGMNLQEAGDAARIVHTDSSQPTGERMHDGGNLQLESGFGSDIRKDLIGRGHTIGRSRGLFGGYQAILWDAKNRTYQGASESRKDGFAAGY
ncbi:MAG: gamma-glutamyltranspeptidase/glutathione hydrolase [Glaciecola sp.]|jgi:gamma-glutamyltranspeptidase/glutathione hydrolase